MKIEPHRTVLITGASRGIGKEFALEVARRSADLVLVGRDQNRLAEVERLAIELGAKKTLVCTVDVGDKNAVENLRKKVYEQFPSIDILVNNAGFGHYASIARLDPDHLHRILQTNLFGPLHLIQAFLPRMMERRKGHIVNVSTIISRRSIPFMSAYCMSKFALNALDEALGAEIRAFGIDVTLFCPGLTQTDFQTNAKKIGYSPPVSNQGGMRADVVAKKLVKAIERRKRRVYLTLGGKLLLLFQWLSPRFVDQALYFGIVKRAKANI